MSSHPSPATDHTEARKLLRQALDSPTADFREGQWEAIDRLVNQRQKLLVVQRTGWGKSSVYFIATRILRNRGFGPTLIVSPLLALMRNQIEAAERLGIRAITVNSTNQNEWPDLTQSVLKDEADALLISDWGHDFRPDYRRLVNVLRRMPPNVPILGTTATANNRVLDDVRRQLGDIHIQRGPLMRQNLALQTLRLPDQSSRLAWLVEQIPNIPGTGIIYTLTKRDATQVAEWLNQHGISAQAYYSDVHSPEFADSNLYRQHLENVLLNNRVKALVATTALGMGYDKPDVGFVIHYQAPGSIIAYYQQVGRAGRAIDQAVGVLLSGKEDEDIHSYFRDHAFPDENQVNSILQLLSTSDGLTERQIEKDVNLRRSQITQVLKFLSVENPAPVIKDGSKWHRTPMTYRMDLAHIQRLTQQRVLEWQEMQTYIDSRDCLMTFLARALDDTNLQPCGKCTSCTGHPVVATSYSTARAVEAARYLRHAELPLQCNKQVAADAFPQYGFRGNLSQDLRAETGRVLSRWGDAGWGRMVADNKRAGHFCDELVHAMVEMIQERWKPSPKPTWVTCVPSLNHPDLVPNFARRVAEALSLPFIDVVIKVVTNEPQKLQQNRFHQCANLDGVFEVKAAVLDGPVLLLDDIVDSVWTMTIVAALLKRSGVGVVWPVALATTSSGD
jgi:ATP-dependent DNA helicase RecQ